MRMFWLLVGLLVIATAVSLLMGRDDVSDLPEMPIVDGPAPVPMAVPDERDPVETAEPAPPVPNDVAAAPPPPEPAIADAARALADELMASAESATREAPPDVAPGASRDDAPPPAPAPADDEVDEPVERVEAPERQFEIRGKGSADDPYQISWDLLVSASETYRPRLEMLDVPELVQQLDGARVRISGFVAVPLVVGEVNEALVMLNQWDGCCIGVPPTPYDAVEVRLSHKIAIPRHQMIPYGTVEGTFRVDPYLVSGWLVGLYVMDDATLEMGM